MFGNKRLAKRSIVGTRVSAMWPQDGRFYPGIIHTQVSEETITNCGVYFIMFDDGFSEKIKSRNIIGPGFQSISSATLKRGQKIYLTLNGREVSGVVIRHDRDTDEVTASIKTPTGEAFDTVRKLEDVRLLESRKSARLIDQQDTDYSKLALSDPQFTTPETVGRGRRVQSHVIDVPSSSTGTWNNKFDSGHHHHRRQRRDSEDGEAALVAGDFDDVEMMDEKIAAMVLTSLSVSPTSPKMIAGQFTTTPKTGGMPIKGRETPPTSSSHSHHHHHSNYPYPDSHLSSSVASSGFYSGHSERDDASPPLPPLSESAPANIEFKPPTPGSDDDSSNSSGRLLIDEGKEESVIYQCTWRGCKQRESTTNAIERHIRRAHFNRDSDVELSDDDEDFYYTEVDVSPHSISTMTKSFAALNTFSSSYDDHQTNAALMMDKTMRQRHPSADNTSTTSGYSSSGRSSISATTVGVPISGGHSGGGVFDHNYQRKQTSHKPSQASSVPSNGPAFLKTQDSTSIPISISEGQIKRSLSWQTHPSSPGSLISPPIRPTKHQERLYQHQAQSPKSSVPPTSFKTAQHRRPRSEVRKCRKVYGMEHRDQWCTQCKWKKACTRFVD